MSTSLISPIKRDSFIVFQSSNEDIELFNRSDKKFKFSHFALLKLPRMKSPTNNENVMQFERIQSRYLSGNSAATPPVEGKRIDLSESFQNYLLNFESVLRSSPNYEQGVLKNPNERIFFKWMKEIGAMRYDLPDTNVSNVSDRFVEEPNNSDSNQGNLYDRVVKYIGEISMQNKVTKNNNNLEEVYLFVPSQVGTFNNPLFKTVNDDVYTQETAYQRQTGDEEYIDGYDSSSTPLNALNLLAQYDVDVQGLTYTSVNQLNTSDTDLWLDYYSGENAYLTDKVFTDYSNDLITVNDGGGALEYLRSRLDGVTLDLEKSSYYTFNDPQIDTFSKAAESGEAFEFNCVLLYYEVEENGVKETNLYGVLFLDELVEISGGEVEIQKRDKIKTSTLLGQTGTGFGMKLNFRIDNANGNIVPEVVTDINDYNVFSMELFSSVSARMAQILDLYEDSILANKELVARNEELLSLLQEDGNNVDSIIDDIKRTIEDTSDTSGLSALVAQNASRINAILNNNTPVEIELAVTPNFTKGIEGGLENGILSLRLSRQSYSQQFSYQLDSSTDNVNEVKIGDRKCLVHFFAQSQIALNTDINIYLQDVDGWVENQEVVLNFGDNIDFNGNNVNIFTDVNGITTNGSYQIQIFSGKVVGNTLNVVCQNASDYTFRILK